MSSFAKGELDLLYEPLEGEAPACALAWRDPAVTGEVGARSSQLNELAHLAQCPVRAYRLWLGPPLAGPSRV